MAPDDGDAYGRGVLRHSYELKEYAKAVGYAQSAADVFANRSGELADACAGQQWREGLPGGARRRGESARACNDSLCGRPDEGESVLTNWAASG